MSNEEIQELKNKTLSTIKDYKAACEKEQSDTYIKWDKEIDKVRIAYGKSIVRYKIGDLITHEALTIKIDIIMIIPTFDGLSSPVYEGLLMTNKGVARKNKKRHRIYQHNIINEV